jgi:hypothetical protein
MRSTALAQTYDQDFYAWLTANVQLMHQGRLDEVDAEHVAEELDAAAMDE